MSNPTNEAIREAFETTGRSYTEAARFLSEAGTPVHRSTVARRLAAMGYFAPVTEEAAFTVDPLPSGDLSFEELVDRRMRDFDLKRTAREARRAIQVNIKMDGPIGIGFFGDPHVDDDGTDLKTLLNHAEIFRQTPGLFAANIGDTRNNWVGRLARLYGEQSTSARQARILAEGFMRSVNWMFVLRGNHDCWLGNDDIVEWLARGQGALCEDHEVRLELNFPNSSKTRIHAAHNFSGHSQYNPVFGVAKKAQKSLWADIYMAGHTHVSGYQMGWSEDHALLWHAVRVASYKVFDRYADELGLDPHSVFVCPVAIIDPYAANPVNKIRWEWDPYEGAERLTWMRRRFESGVSY